MFCIHLVEDRRGLVNEELVLEQELDVIPAGQGSPMRPCAIDEIEKGNIRDSIQRLFVSVNDLRAMICAHTLEPARKAR